MRKRTNDPDGHAQRAARECPRCRRPWPSNEPQTDTEGERRIEERVAILRAHRVVTNEESDTNHGRYAGSCIVCGTEWPCVYHPPRPPEGAGEAGPTCPHCDLPYDAHAPGCPNRGETRAPVTPPKTVPGWKLPEKARGPDSDQGYDIPVYELDDPELKAAKFFVRHNIDPSGGACGCRGCASVRARLRASTGERIEGFVEAEEADCSCSLAGAWLFNRDCGHFGNLNRRATLLLHPTDGGEG